jgi:Bacterial extracellular solute-binding protein
VFEADGEHSGSADGSKSSQTVCRSWIGIFGGIVPVQDRHTGLPRPGEARAPATVTDLTCTSGMSAPLSRNGKRDEANLRTAWEISPMKFGILAAATALLASVSTQALAVTDIQWWHAMTGANNDRIVKLANDFNAAQADYRVIPTYKGSYADTMNAGIASFRAGNAPGILQVFEVGTATMMAAKGAVKPVYQMMKDAGEPFDEKSYLPAVTGYYSTSKGEMLSFPFNASTMVLWVNQDALKKANIGAAPKTWPEAFEDAKLLKAAG